MTLLPLLITKVALGQDHAFRQFTVDEGLPSSEVYNIYQAKDGHIIFTTDRGISRYDGYRFRNYSLQDGLPGNTVFGGYKDEQENIHFFTYDGDIFTFINDQVEVIGAGELKQMVNFNTVIFNLMVDDNKRNWIALSNYRKGFLVVDSSGHLKKEMIPHPESQIQMRYMGEGRYLCAYNENADQVILNLSNGRKLDITAIALEESMNVGNVLNAIERGTSLYLAFRHGLAHFNMDTGDYVYWSYKEDLSNNIFMDSEDNLWVGLAQRGILKYQSQDLTVPPDTLLKGKTVTAFLEDREGGKWFATLDHGVYYMPWNDLYYYNDIDGMCKTVTVYNEEVWAGFSRGGVVHYNTESLPPAIYKLPYSNHRQGTVESFCEDEKQLYGVCSNMIYDLTLTDMNNTKYNNTYIRKLIHDGHDMWGLGNGFYLMKNDSIKYSSPEEDQFDEWVTTMTKVKDSSYLIGTFTGLYQFDGMNISPYGDGKDPLFSQRISNIKLSGDNNLIVTTIGNGLLLEHETGLLHIQKGDNGLLSNVCNTLFIENDSTFWVATNEGINTVRRRSGADDNITYTVEGFTKEDGLRSNEVYDLLIKDNYVWAGTNQGLVKFRKDMYNYDQYVLPVHLNYFKAVDFEVDITGPIELSSDQNSIELSYTALFFKNPDKIRYRYRLLPNREWTFTKNTQIHFLNLAERAYNLELEASIDNAHWFGLNEDISFVINPPVWRSTAFQVGYLVSGILLLWLLFYYQFSVFKKRSLLKRKAFEAEQKALRARVNPHFIFNSLNSINSFILGNDKLIASQYLAKFSGLMRQMLDNSEETTIAIQKEIDMLSLYMAMEALRVEKKFNFNITYDDDLNVEKCFIPSMLIQPFVENAIWHGIIPLKGRKGHISVHFSSASVNSVICVVDDNGVGREEQGGIKKPRHRSQGMSLIKNRLAIISEIRNDDYHIDTFDKRHEDGNAAGTRIKIVLPVTSKK